MEDCTWAATSCRDKWTAPCAKYQPTSCRSLKVTATVLWLSGHLVPVSKIMPGSPCRGYSMSWAPQLPMPLACGPGTLLLRSEDARQLHVIEAAFVENWRLLTAMLPLRFLKRCPASIREGPMANVGHLSRTVIDSPSLVQPSACLRKCKRARSCYSPGRTPPQALSLSTRAISGTKGKASVVEDC